MTYERFFKRLETCGGCAGPRDKTHCSFTVVCTYVEKLAKKGVIRSSKDFCYPTTTGSDLMLNTVESGLPGIASINPPTNEIPPGIGPCNAD
ncbi:MAG TPA: hypothetical protein DEF42_10245 [Desulfosporosinus sp.]|nr:hypothetical protein [Desulfosporosinus sp.]